MSTLPSIAPKLRSILSLPGGWGSLPPTERAELAHIVDEFPHDAAEARASEKQLAFQRAFIARQDAQGRRCDIFVAIGGNRSGKSFVCGWLCLAKWLRYCARAGSIIWCVAQTLDRSIGGQQREIWESLPRHVFGADQTWDEKLGFGMHRKLVLPTPDDGKCLVEFRSADQAPSTFEQAKLDGVWIDERCPEAIYNRLLARIIDKRGFILYSDIPEQFWQMERLREAEANAGVYWQGFGMRDNAGNLPDGEIDRAAARMTSDERKLRVEGEFVVLEGIVYREFVDKLDSEGGHLVTGFAIPDDWPKWRMIDYGGSSPTACLWATVAPTEEILIYREYYERGPDVSIHAKRIIEASGDEKYVANLIDPAAYNTQPGLKTVNGVVETIAVQYAQSGIKPIAPWPHTNQMGEHAMVQKVKFRYENRTIRVFEHLVNFRREKRSWKYKLDKDGKPVETDLFENANNHLLDCEKGFIATRPTFNQSRCEVGTGE